MLLKNFRINVIIRILLLSINIFLIIFLIEKTTLEISEILLMLLFVVQVINLIKYVEKTNQKLKQFLESIRYSDFSCTFTDNALGKSFKTLNKELNNIIEEFKKNRIAKEEQYNYLQTIVQHVPIGIIVYNKRGEIDIFNKEVKKLLNFSNIKNIQELSKIKPNLPQLLLNIKTGDKDLVKIFIENQILQLSIYATEFRLRKEDYILISLQDIHLELEEKEIDSWQKLIRVLTHEVMNSITPISSLASTVNELLVDEKTKKLKTQNIDDETAESVQTALNIIEKRSQGLKNFIEIYRNYTRIPKPNFRYFSLSDFFERNLQLLKPKIDKLNISCSYNIFPNDLMLTADPDLMDQVIINLFLNAIDAVKKTSNPKISIQAFQNTKGKILINVSDNGYGIKPDILDKIFMPFFTSKKSGSGIGLSLSRQIMHIHKGNIFVKSIPDEGSIFTLSF